MSSRFWHKVYSLGIREGHGVPYVLVKPAALQHITVAVKARWTEISCGDMGRIRLSVRHQQANKGSSYKIGLHKLGAYFTSGVMSSWLSVF